MAKPKVTRIKAGESSESSSLDDVAPITRKEIKIKDKKQEKAKKKASRREEKALKRKEKSATGKKPFILIRPFVYFGRYLYNSWKELRQVRWPNRKATWKMVLAVLAYTALFMILISLLDLFFTWLFGNIIK